jgi:ribosomal protein L11 methyltransferase
MPYRVYISEIDSALSNQALDRLIELGALDVERRLELGIAAVMPDRVAPKEIARALGVERISVSPAAGRDADSVWVLSPRPVRVGRLRIVPADADAEPGALRLIDARAFGTGLHPTTALCLETLDDTLQIAIPDTILDVGTGSGILALAALTMGVPNAMGVDVDELSLHVAEENARINGLQTRLTLARGGPEAAPGTWPLVLANILAASLVEMAPTLVRRVGHNGRLVLSGVSHALEQEVAGAYRRLGMQSVDVKSRGGWVAMVLQATW